MLANVLSALALVSAGITIWQWVVARRFPLHRREGGAGREGVTVLKPLKGCDAETERCLRSWFEQEYDGPVQLLFGVASEEDPVCDLLCRLIQEYPERGAELAVCGERLGANAKVTTLAQLEPRIRHELVLVSDADVRVPGDFLARFVPGLREPETGLISCFYQLANPATAAMHWEAVAVNADFWSQVLQAASLKAPDFALGAVMGTSRSWLKRVGGFAPLLDYLADDYQLGNRIAREGGRVHISTLVVECWDRPMGWRDVWTHQARWARTIRVCQPVPFFFSIVQNATFWPLAWFVVQPVGGVALLGGLFLVARILSAWDNQRRLTGQRGGLWLIGLVPLKDLLQVAVWVSAFAGREVEWRGQTYRVRPGGKLEKAGEHRGEARRFVEVRR